MAKITKWLKNVRFPQSLKRACTANLHQRCTTATLTPVELISIVFRRAQVRNAVSPDSILHVICEQRYIMNDNATTKIIKSGPNQMARRTNTASLSVFGVSDGVEKSRQRE